MTKDSKGFWRTKDGRDIRIADMADGHLRNTIRMLREKGFIEASTLHFYLGCTAPRGDMASMAFEQEFDAVISMIPSRSLDELVTELESRNLTELEWRY